MERIFAGYRREIKINFIFLIVKFFSFFFCFVIFLKIIKIWPCFSTPGPLSKRQEGISVLQGRDRRQGP